MSATLAVFVYIYNFQCIKRQASGDMASYVFRPGESQGTHAALFGLTAIYRSDFDRSFKIQARTISGSTRRARWNMEFGR